VTEAFVKSSELKEKIYGSVTILKDLPAKIEVHDGLHHVSAEGEIVQSAQNRPLLEEDIRKRLMKTGQTPFQFEQLDIQTSDGCYMSIQGLNQLRREALEQLEAECLSDYRRKPAKMAEEASLPKGHNQTPPEVHVLVSNLQQLDQALAFPEVSRIYLNDENQDALVIQMAQQIHRSGRKFYLALPYIMRPETAALYRNRSILKDTSLIDGFLVRNPETVFLLRSIGVSQPCIGDCQLYAMNDHANAAWLQLLSETTLPLELNRRELSELQYTSRSEMIVYGYMPLMISAQCLTKTTGKCTHTPALCYLEDRKHKRFPVKNVCSFCYNLIYNSVPLYLTDVAAGDYRKIGPKSIRLQFLDESPERTADLIQAFLSALSSGQTGEPVIRDYTKGHYQRGIE
jgi:putative protease